MAVKGFKTTVACNRLLAGEASKAIIAAPGTGKRLVIVKANYQVVVAAAQAVDVGVDGGGVTKQILSLAASASGASGVNLGDGFALDTNVALTAKPAAAGPVVQFQVEYYVEEVSV